MTSRTSLQRGALIGLFAALLTLVPSVVLASSLLPISATVAQRALTYSTPAAHESDEFYEDVGATKTHANATIANLIQTKHVLDVNGYHGQDALIDELIAQEGDAMAKAQQAHDEGQHVNNITAALDRDLRATAGVPTP